MFRLCDGNRQIRFRNAEVVSSILTGGFGSEPRNTSVSGTLTISCISYRSVPNSAVALFGLRRKGYANAETEQY